MIPSVFHTLASGVAAGKQKPLLQAEKAWRLLHAFRNFRQNIDSVIAAWNDSTEPKKHGPYHGLFQGAALAAVAVAAVALGAAFAHVTKPTTGPYGPFVSLPASFTVLSADTHYQESDSADPYPGQNPRPLYTGVFSGDARQDSGSGSSVINAASVSAKGSMRNGIIHFSKGRVTIETTDGSVPITHLRQSAALSRAFSIDPIEADLFTPASGTNQRLPSLFYGEELDSNGTPIRWNWRNEDYLKKTIKTCDLSDDMRAIGTRRLILGMLAPVPRTYYGLQAGKYRDFVSQYAEKYDLAAGLMLAIMHTESNFNPFAVSPSQAVGLMQIVPDTAGNEVYRYLMGTSGTPSVETLFSPEHNIKYGAIYLHLLERRHFGGVANAASRQLCVIAAYNGGPNAVLRVFDANQSTAIERINSMTPQQVYTTLTTQMPNAETRLYVEIVMNRLRTYSSN